MLTRTDKYDLAPFVVIFDAYAKDDRERQIRHDSPMRILEDASHILVDVVDRLDRGAGT